MDIEERGWSMAGKRNFTFSFDEKKTLLIRNTIDEHAVFATQAEYIVNVAEERGKNGFRTTKKPLWVYDAVYASLSRVEDTLHYINSLDLPSEGSSKQRRAFDFFDFINNLLPLILVITAYSPSSISSSSSQIVDQIKPFIFPSPTSL